MCKTRDTTDNDGHRVFHLTLRTALSRVLTARPVTRFLTAVRMVGHV